MSQSLQDVLSELKAMSPEVKAGVVKEVMSVSRRPWVPNPGPQKNAYYCEADELFYGGQAGGGKTDLLIGLSLNEHNRSLILRRTNTEAEKLPDRYIEVLESSEGLRRSPSIVWKLENRIIDIGGCQLESDKQKRKGIPHDLKGFDEIGDFTRSQYKFIIAWNRAANPDQRCRVVCTGNPPTEAEGFWVIEYWGAWLNPTHPNPAADGELRWYTTDPETGKEIEVEGRGPHPIGGEMIEARSRTFIRSTLQDNPDLAMTNYDSVLAALPERERLAYREGRFDAALQDKIGQAVPTSWIRAAQSRWNPSPPSHIPMCSIGVDCTGGGKDPMVMCPRFDGWFANPVVIPATRFHEETLSQEAAGEIIAIRRDKALVIIDLGGGYGAGTYEQLNENDIRVYGYKGSEGSMARSKESSIPFANKRSQAIWQFRESLDPSQPGGSPIQLPDDPEMVADLTAPTYEIRNHVIHIESKEKVCDRLGRSTDKGDGVIMAWFQGEKEATSAMEWIDLKEQSRKRGQAPKVITSRTPRTARGRH